MKVATCGKVMVSTPKGSHFVPIDVRKSESFNSKLIFYIVMG